MGKHGLQDMTPDDALHLVKEAEGMDWGGIEGLQRERLSFLLSWARKLSPFLKQKYADLSQDPDLADIPPITRSEATRNFDDWVCDRDVTLEGAKRFLADPKNLLEEFLGRYRILTTSGTTDVPLILLRDDRHNMVNAALMASRLFGGGKLGGIKRLTEMGCRSCGIIAAGGFHSSYLSFLRMKKIYDERGLGDHLLALPVDMSTAEKVEMLNAFQPELFAGYPSSLQILAYAQKEGKLKISPRAIVCSAEHLSNEVLHLLERSFKCPVMNNYCSTEGGEVAMLCPENHMHVNEDWIIVEPVDADNRPIPDGILSDGVLITNLANMVQPIIRYRITDRVVMHHEPCPCGLPFPYMEIEGRKEDILEFRGTAGQALVTPIILTVAAMHVDGCLCGQFIQRSPTSLEIRYENTDWRPRSKVGAELLEATKGVLAKNGAGNIDVHLSEEPVQIGKSGKIRFTFQEFR